MQELVVFAMPVSSVTITEQAPQSPSLHPSFVPVSPLTSRKKFNRVSEDFTSAFTTSPFRRNVTIKNHPAAIPKDYLESVFC